MPNSEAQLLAGEDSMWENIGYGICSISSEPRTKLNTEGRASLYHNFQSQFLTVGALIMETLEPALSARFQTVVL